MSSWQKAIKYVAMALAIFLIVSIVGNIARLAASFTLLFGTGTVAVDLDSFTVSGDIQSLEVNINAADFEIKTGKNFGIETNNKDITVKEKGKTLVISEKKRFRSSNDVKLVLTVPEDFVFKKIKITTGAGAMRAELLRADKLDLKLGAGEVNIENLIVNDKSEIEGGAGKVTIFSESLTNLDLDMGVGELKLTGKLRESCDISTGVGAADIVLLGSAEDYRIEIDKGLGKATVDGVEMRDGNVYGTGDTEVEIDGGIGEIKVSFKQ